MVRMRRVVWPVLVTAALVLAFGGCQRIAELPQPGQPAPRAVRDCAVPAKYAPDSVSPTASPAPREPGGRDLSAREQELFDQVKAEVEAFRGISLKEPLRLRAMSRNEIVDYMKAETQRPSARRALEKADDFLTFLGMIAPDQQLGTMLGDAYGEEVVGFYDGDSKLLVFESGFLSGNRIVAGGLIAHEFAHALDDQHFGIDQRLEQLDEVERQDEAVAFTSAVEGSAMVVTNEYITRELGEAIPGDPFETIAEAARSGETRDLPAFLDEMMLFPYVSGGRFVDRVRASGGWSAVNAMLAKPPKTTAEIMHPELYLDSFVPTKVPIGPVTETIEEVRDERWFALNNGSAGELDISLILQSQGISTHWEAARGWRGDSFIFVGCDDLRLLALEAEFTNESEAVEAAKAIKAWGETWVTGAPWPAMSTTDAGDVTVTATAAGRSWVVDRRGVSVTMVISNDRRLAAQVAGGI